MTDEGHSSAYDSGNPSISASVSPKTEKQLCGNPARRKMDAVSYASSKTLASDKVVNTVGMLSKTFRPLAMTHA